MTAAQPIDFYFDFSSPYGFLAAQKIEALAARFGRGVDWHPILLGAVFKQTGTAPLTEIPLKGEYSRRDFERSARFHGLPSFKLPARFPIATQGPARILLWLKRTDPSRVPAAALAMLRAYYEGHHDISVPENAVAALAPLGIDAIAARAAIDDPAYKEALRAAMDEALRQGVFGSPYIVVDGEPFWGLDRFPQIERWLETGGF